MLASPENPKKTTAGKGGERGPPRLRYRGGQGRNPSSESSRDALDEPGTLARVVHDTAALRSLACLDLRTLQEELLRSVDRRVARLYQLIAPRPDRLRRREDGGVIVQAGVAALVARVIAPLAEIEQLAVGLRDLAREARTLRLHVRVLGPECGHLGGGSALGGRRSTHLEDPHVLRGLVARGERDPLAAWLVNAAAVSPMLNLLRSVCH